MRRFILATAIAAAAVGGLSTTPASADACVAGLACAVQNSCTGLVNTCPNADECAGTVNVCPNADDCRGGVNVCDTRTTTR
jgi:hypothetical protein